MAEEPKKTLFTRFRETISPYVELAGYLKPYRMRFILGTLCGVGFGAVSGSLPFLINFVGKVVFSGGTEVNMAEEMKNIGGLATPVNFLALHVFQLDHVSKLFLVIVACLLIPAVMMVRSALDFLNNYYSDWTSQKVLIDIRARLMQHITVEVLE